MSDKDLTPRPLKVRKQRQNDTITPTHRFNHENGLATSSMLPVSRNASVRGVVTANDAIRQQAAVMQIDSGPGLRRQPSLKHRLLNRMMSGLTARTQINGIDEEDEQTEHMMSSVKANRNASRSSTASSDSDTYGLNDLDAALAAFPTPPTSNIISPITDRSLESIELQTQTYRDLCKPRSDIALAAELRIIPYRDHHQSHRSTLVAIEISTTVNRGSLDYELQAQRNAVDVAVVIDNSLYNSPATLMASCEIAGLFASFLDTNTDRMAVICTMPADTKQNTCNPTVVSPLSRINPRKLKAKLDNVISSTGQPRSEAMIAALKDAQQILMRSERLSSIGEPQCNTFGHIIVLTADISALWGKDLSHQTLQTHILCTGLPQQREWDEIECSGWKMCILNAFLTRNHSHNFTSKKDMDPRSLNNMLQTLIRHAHYGGLAGFLTDVVLDIEHRSEFIIKKTMGWSNYSKLQIGEVKTIVLRLLAAGHASSPDSVDSQKWCDSTASPSGDDLMAELDRMLGFPKDGMITIKLNYKHSSLPANTICTTTAKCLIHVPLSTPEGKQSVRKPVFSKAKVLLHQRLAEYYATYFKPRDAISSLRREFGEGGCRSACPVYINAIADELKYQARISERIAIENSPQKPIVQYKEPHPDTRIACFGQSALSSENYKPREWINVPDEDIFVPIGSHVQVAEQLGLDNARKIWNELRNMSRGDRSENTKNFSTSPTHQERAKEITEMALKNKRSIGESTLRSLSTPVRRSSKGGLIAPWL